MSRKYGSQSMVGELHAVLMRRPDEAFGNADPQKWHYTSSINLEIAQQEHDALVKTIQGCGAEVVYHDEMLPDHADAIFVHDPVIVSNQGAILLNMGKPLRQGEETAIGRSLEKMGVPIHYQLTGDARAEGGDLLWVDENTLAVGLGFRTNQAGFNQLAKAFEDTEVSLVPVHLPYFQGPEACLHLMSFISVVDHDVAVVYEPLMPVPFWQHLKEKGFRFVQVPEEEWETMGPNVLSVAPGKCILLENNKTTIARLKNAGCDVMTYKGEEISLKAEGGATCLTRPVLRA
ncbi:MAG: arginine deiminase family protein [Chloroflexota bacterium]